MTCLVGLVFLIQDIPDLYSDGYSDTGINSLRIRGIESINRLDCAKCRFHSSIATTFNISI